MKCRMCKAVLVCLIIQYILAADTSWARGSFWLTALNLVCALGFFGVFIYQFKKEKP